MQTKQYAMKKDELIFKKKQDLQGTTFCGVLMLQEVRIVFNICCFSYALGIFETGFKMIF